MRGVTNRQKQVLQVVYDYTKANGYPPSIREIGEEIGANSLGHLDALERKGLMVRDACTARSIRLTQKGLEAIGVDCQGDMALAMQEIYGLMTFDEGLIESLPYCVSSKLIEAKRLAGKFAGEDANEGL